MIDTWAVKKWLDSEIIFKIEQIGFAGRSDPGYEQKREVRDFSLSN
jgi:hypothetical protein